MNECIGKLHKIRIHELIQFNFTIISWGGGRLILIGHLEDKTEIETVQVDGHSPFGHHLNVQTLQIHLAIV